MESDGVGVSLEESDGVVLKRRATIFGCLWCSQPLVRSCSLGVSDLRCLMCVLIVEIDSIYRLFEKQEH